MPTFGARYAENRGQKVGHLTEIYNFRLYFALFEQHYIVLKITHFG